MYHGWKNYKTHNVALWINNDEMLYLLSKDYRHSGYKSFLNALSECQCVEWLTYETPDNVRWDDSEIDIESINEMMKTL